MRKTLWGFLILSLLIGYTGTASAESHHSTQPEKQVIISAHEQDANDSSSEETGVPQQQTTDTDDEAPVDGDDNQPNPERDYE